MDHIPDRLAKVQAAQARADATRRSTCDHKAPVVLMVWRLRSGEDRIYEACTVCHAQQGGIISRSKAGIPIDELEVGIDERMANPPCRRCGAFGTELHHWMPVAAVGREEADRWPADYLCPPCHRYWHSVIRAEANRAG